jgi:hypothetical protein
MKRLTAILVAFVLGCASVPQLQRVERPEPVNEKWLILAPDLALYVPEWHRQFCDALGRSDVYVVACHGTDWRNQWMYGLGDAVNARPVGHVRNLVAWVRLSIGPDRPLVLLICNPGSVLLNEPNVYQALTSVWAKPGEDIREMEGHWRVLAGGPDDFVRVR